MRRATRRISIIILIVGWVILTAAALLRFEHSQLLKEMQQNRDRALQMVQDRQYEAAIEPLQTYLNHTGEVDADALYGLAQAVRHIQEPNDRHRVRATRLLRQVVELQPDNQQARQSLLELIQELGFDLETIEIADQLLEQDPQCELAVRAKAVTFLKLQQFEKALTMAERWQALSPTSLEPRYLTLQILNQGPWPNARSVTWAKQVGRGTLDDVSYQLLLVRAYRLAGRRADARRLLDTLVDTQASIPNVIVELVRELNAVGRFSQSAAVLERSAQQSDAPVLTRMYVQLLWQQGAYETIATHLRQITSQSDDAEPLFVALKAMSLRRMGRIAASEALIDQLRHRRNDPVAAGWAVYLGGVFDRRISVVRAIQRCRSALRLDPTNIYVQYELAELLDEFGVDAEATTLWMRVADTCSFWLQPRIRAARGLTKLGLVTQAVQMAEAAVERAPNDTSAKVALAFARAARWRQDAGESAAAVLQLVEAIQTHHPGESQTLPLYVELLIAEGRREDAGRVLLVALDGSLPESTLLALAKVSREHGLGLTDTCFFQSQSQYGRTPSLAVVEAVDLWKRGRADEAYARLAPPQNSADPDARRAWQLAHTQFLEQVNADEAVTAWQELVDAWPHDIQVHQAALAAVSTQNDHVFQQKLIDRLSDLLGDEALICRVARARQIILTRGSQQSLLTAVRELGTLVRRVPILIEPRVMLAKAFYDLGEIDTAVEQLQATRTLAPYSRQVTLELATLFLDQGRTVEATSLLGELLNSDATTISELQRTASLFIRARQWDQAALALTRTLEAGGRVDEELLVSRDGLLPLKPADGPSNTSER